MVLRGGAGESAQSHEEGGYADCRRELAVPTENGALDHRTKVLEEWVRAGGGKLRRGRRRRDTRLWSMLNRWRVSAL